VVVDPTLEVVLRAAAPLTEYAWKFRYPGDLERPPPAEAEDAVRVARGVFQALASRLPAEVNP
jgi:hypothetical protein